MFFTLFVKVNLQYLLDGITLNSAYKIFKINSADFCFIMHILACGVTIATFWQCQSQLYLSIYMIELCQILHAKYLKYISSTDLILSYITNDALTVFFTLFVIINLQYLLDGIILNSTCKIF